MPCEIARIFDPDVAELVLDDLKDHVHLLGRLALLELRDVRDFDRRAGGLVLDLGAAQPWDDLRPYLRRQVLDFVNE